MYSSKNAIYKAIGLFAMSSNFQMEMNREQNTAVTVCAGIYSPYPPHVKSLH